MRKLVVITQKVDSNDDLLGFFVGWLAELAKHFDAIEVITLGVGHYDLPPNVSVHSLGKEGGSSRFTRGLRLLTYLWRYSAGCSAIFAHMSPVFAIVAWPFARLRRCRLALWYLHRSVTFRLRLAAMLSDTILTADAGSLRLKNPKVKEVGHGIDVAKFSVVRDWSALDKRPMHILSVGRISPIKDFGTLIRATAILRDRDFDVQVRIVGRPVMPGDREYEVSLQELSAKLGLSDRVHFVGFVPYSGIAEQYAWADVVVGCTPPGGIDKVLLEAMAAGCPVLTSNSVMDSYLSSHSERLIFNHGDDNSLAEQIARLTDFEHISQMMVQSVLDSHDLKRTISRISDLL